MQLLTQQVSAIDKLHKYKVGALFMQPGTGKTRTAMELIRSIPDPDFILWLTPFQSKQNLQDEINKQGGLNCQIVGIETLSSSSKTYLELYAHLESCTNPVIIVDESLKIKNWSAKRTKRICELGKFSQYKLILNGTPLSRNLLDIWAQMEFLSPKILNMGISEFKNTFCEYTRVTKRFGGKQFSKEFITKYHNVDYLYNLIGRYVYECDLQLDINKQYHDWAYTIPEDIKNEYYRLKEEYLDNEKLMMMNNNIFLELTQKMQHLYSCSENKFDLLSAICEAHNPEKVIVFTKYIRSFQEVSKRFPKLKTLSIQKNAFGFNLQQFSVTVFFDKVWDYALRNQAEHRTERTGQVDDLFFYDFTGDVGLEDMINKNIIKKQGLSEYFKQKATSEILNEL